MFHSARIKLTAWYLLIIMAISISFSIVIYREFQNEVERFARSQRYRIERQLRGGTPLPAAVHPQNTFMPPLSDPDLVADTKRRLLFVLCLINGSIFILSGGLGYFLAGMTLKPIKDMLDEQNQFITDASHEFRTPLTSLKSAMEVNLRDKHITLAEAKILIKESITDVNKLQSLSDKLLQLSQYQKPNDVLPFKKLDIRDVIQRAIRSVEPSAKRKRITVNNAVKRMTVEGNAHQLTDLFVILLDNAVKYSQNGKSILVRARKTDGSLSASVQDWGIGIDQKDIPHIFDRFYRADSARIKNNKGGYGLGLSIAKKIVDHYHGSIRVESKPGKGSTFMVRIPLKQI
jgi:two-component system sensor histidine kinase CiaH